MSCINLKIRTKDYEKYLYCKSRKKKITYADCKNCNQKQYKKIKKIKGKKHKSTKATEIPTKLKKVVWERDNRKCIFCGKTVEIFNANAHLVKRSALGKGIEQNLFTACDECHYEQDHGSNTEEMTRKAENYLKSIYGEDWKKENLIYKKYNF